MSALSNSPLNTATKSAQKSFGWGIVGTGNIATKFADDLQHVPGAQKTAIYSRNGQTGSAFAAKFGFEKNYMNMTEFLSDPHIDIVYIATPHVAHLDQALAAILAGKAVLIEKPITMSAQEARIIEQQSAQHNVFAMEALWSRFLPPVQQAKAIIDSGRLGQITRAEASLIYHRAYDPSDRLFNPDLGGGVLHDLGVYPISVCAYLLGAPTLISSQWFAAPNGVNKHATIKLSCGDVPVSIETGFSDRKDREGENSLIIYGSEGTLRIDRHFLRSQSITVWDRPKASVGPVRGSLKNRIADKLELHGGKRSRFPMMGNGLHFQASAVQAALGQGLIAHPVMPLEMSACVIGIIEEVLAHPPSER